ncbi:MAG: serine hydrolase domain-containing protein [Gemmatimonadota bacterium]
MRTTHPRIAARRLFCLLALPLLIAPAGAAAQNAEPYYPGPGEDWERRSPAQVGMDAERLQEAIDWASDPDHEGWDRDLEHALRLFLAGEPENEIVGPMKPHGPMTGIVIRHGYIIAEWGDPTRVDMTFSVTKSFNSTVAGLAYDRGLIRDVHDRVQPYVPYGHFDSEHNSKITWDMLLRQNSEWEGELWGKPHWVDRFDGEIRELQEPGTYYEYNDVRVNLLALSLLHVWRRPLPRVLKEHVMDPIDASNTWRWHGYENSWVTIDGLRMQSVSGGGHWGGGMWISARDQARFGLLSLRRGQWNGRQVLSEEWIEMATTPSPQNRNYGFMNWTLNTDRASVPSAPENSFYHSGAGVNRIWVSPDHDLVVVVRWLDGQYFDGFIERVLAAVEDTRVSSR